MLVLLYEFHNVACNVKFADDRIKSRAPCDLQQATAGRTCSVEQLPSAQSTVLDAVGRRHSMRATGTALAKGKSHSFPSALETLLSVSGQQ